MGLDSVIDKQLIVHQRWHARQRERLRALIDDELIEEHRADPLGHHSAALQRVLQYFRCQPPAGKYIAVMTKPWSEYRIGVLPGIRGQPAVVLGDETFATEQEVLHGVFLRRVRDLVEG